jgi:hypothetical protein
VLLHSIELVLNVVEPADTCQVTGYRGHALFLGIIRRTDPNMAARLHWGKHQVLHPILLSLEHLSGHYWSDSGKTGCVL